MTRAGAIRDRRRPAAVPEPATREAFPPRNRFTRSGKPVGEICFECECRILEIGGPDGMLLAWCECGWPDDHAELEIV